MRPVFLAALLSAAASASTVTVSSSTAPTSAGALKARTSRSIHAVIHKDAVDWEPVSLRTGGTPGSAGNTITLKVLKLKGRLKGEIAKAKSAARLHKGIKDSRWLAISLYPKALERRRTHFEVRFRIFEGYIEEVEVAAVTVTDRRRPPSARLLDSYDLREEGIEYQEERPGSGQLIVAELDPRPGEASVNSGRLEKAEFADKTLGFVNLSWSVKGVRAAKK